MRKVTPEEVRDAMIAAAITQVASWECDVCHEMTYYRRKGAELYLDVSCGCRNPDPFPLEWQSVADNINADPEYGRVLAARFGLLLGPLIDPHRNGNGGAPKFDDLYPQDGLPR